MDNEEELELFARYRLQTREDVERQAHQVRIERLVPIFERDVAAAGGNARRLEWRLTSRRNHALGEMGGDMTSTYQQVNQLFYPIIEFISAMPEANSIKYKIQISWSMRMDDERFVSIPARFALQFTPENFYAFSEAILERIQAMAQSNSSPYFEEGGQIIASFLRLGAREGGADGDKKAKSTKYHYSPRQFSGIPCLIAAMNAAHQVAKLMWKERNMGDYTLKQAWRLVGKHMDTLHNQNYLYQDLKVIHHGMMGTHEFNAADAATVVNLFANMVFRDVHGGEYVPIRFFLDMCDGEEAKEVYKSSEVPDDAIRMMLRLKDNHFTVRKEFDTYADNKERVVKALVKTKANVKDKTYEVHKTFDLIKPDWRQRKQRRVLEANSATRCPACDAPKLGHAEYEDSPSTCADCGVFIRGAACEAAHATRCAPHKCTRCMDGFRTIEEMRSHKCKMWTCPQPGCAETAARCVGNHACVMQVDEPKRLRKGIMAYDLETRHDSIKSNERAICVVVSWVPFDETYVERANKAMEDVGYEVNGDARDEALRALDSLVKYDEMETRTFVGEDCLDGLIDMIYAGTFQGYACVAHNGSRFDQILMMDAMLKRDPNMFASTVSTIVNGTGIKILTVRAPTTDEGMDDGDSMRNKKKERPEELMWLIDSQAHIPLPLRKVGPAMGLTVSKGDFPFKILEREDWATAVLPTIPDLSYFPAHVDKTWHADRARNAVAYNVKEEMIKYCTLDVEVLIRACCVAEVETAKRYMRACGKYFGEFSHATGAAAAHAANTQLFVKRNFKDKMPPQTPWAYMHPKYGVARARYIMLEEREKGRAFESFLVSGKPVPITKDLDADAVDRVASPPVAYRISPCLESGCVRCYGGKYREYCVVPEPTPESVEESRLTDLREEKRRERAAADPDAKPGEGKKRRRGEVKFLTLEDAHHEAMLEDVTIADMGYEVRRVNMCDAIERVDRLKITNPRLKDELFDTVVGRRKMAVINIQDAYKGGYTAPTMLYYKCMPHERIESVDVTSMYPYTMTLDFPTGTPLRLHRGDSNHAAVFAATIRAQRFGSSCRGFAMVRILVNAAQLQPVLCHRHGNETWNTAAGEKVGMTDAKLCASACSKCGAKTPLTKCEHSDLMKCDTCEAEGAPTCVHINCCAECQLEHMGAECAHTDEEREFVGTWSTYELNMAMESGDKILEIYHALHFETWEPLFRDFVFANYAAKELASPWSREVLEDPREDEAKSEDWEKTQKACEKLFGKRMDATWRDRLPNPGARQCAKITMNSAYGKLAEKLDKNNQVYISTADQYRELTDKHETVNMELKAIVECEDDPGKNVAIIHVTSATPKYDRARKTSVYCAAMVTAYGRVMLVKKMREHAARVIMCDTDSVMYVRDTREKESSGATSSFLGGWDPEPDKWATEYASLGPKTYALRLMNGRQMVKAKGIRGDGSKDWGVETFRDIITGVLPTKTASQLQFVVNSSSDGFSISIDPEMTRRVRLTMAKRRIMPFVFFPEGGALRAVMSVPFGYSGPHPAHLLPTNE